MMNKVKEELQNGEKVIGCFVGFNSPTIVEILGISGFDFVVIDNEHGPFSWAEVEHMVRAAQLRDITPIIRVVDSQPGTILKAFDSGAQGIHVPQVSTDEQAEAIVQAAKFPPLGKRGVAWSARSHLFGAGDGARYLQRHNEESLVAIHIETAEAVENLEQILSVPGIDIAYVGPVDLSVSMGYAAEGPGHPEVEAAAARILEVARKHGVKVGYQVGNARDAQARFDWGADYVGVGITPVLYSAFKHIVSARV